MFLPHPWEATEEAGAMCFACGCLKVGQSSLLSLQQFPVTAELHRASHAPFMATAPVWNCREFQPGPTSSSCMSEVHKRSLLGFPLCQDHSHKRVKAVLSGDESQRLFLLLLWRAFSIFSKGSPGAWLGGEDASGKGQHSRINSAKSKIKLKRA